MDINKPKFTLLQQGILSFLFKEAGRSFNARTLARQIKVSPTAISKSLAGLEKDGLIKVAKGKESKRFSISLNRDNPKALVLKRVENLKLVYVSGLVDNLSDKFPGAAIVLFGSYSFGEDTAESDIDIAVIGAKEKDADLKRFEKLLGKPVVLNFYDGIAKLDRNLKESIINGIVLAGGIAL